MRLFWLPLDEALTDGREIVILSNANIEVAAQTRVVSLYSIEFFIDEIL